MTAELFNVVFRGDIAPGQSLAEVQARFAQLFKLSPEKVAAYFSGRPVALKKACDRATAEKFIQALSQIGCQAKLDPVENTAPVVAPAAPKAVAPEAPAAPAALATAVSAESAGEATPAGDAVEAKQIDISHLSLVKRNPFSTDDEEPLEPPRMVVAPALDLSKLAVEPLSEQWLESEREIPELTLDLSAISLDQLGADLLRPDEVPVVVPVTVDVSALDLAAAGSDLGELLAPPPPPAPDTSHLSLN